MSPLYWNACQSSDRPLVEHFLKWDPAIVPGVGRSLRRELFSSNPREGVDVISSDFVEINESDFEHFKECYASWHEFFRLGDYNYLFFHEELDGAVASVSVDTEGRGCYVKCCTSCPKVVLDAYPIDSWALHEILHVVLADLSNAARDPEYCDRAYYAEEEAAVVRLTDAFLRM